MRAQKSLISDIFVTNIFIFERLISIKYDTSVADNG